MNAPAIGGDAYMLPEDPALYWVKIAAIVVMLAALLVYICEQERRRGQG